MTARLLKVIVQPIYVVDDGEDLTEVNIQPVPMTPAEWKALDPAAWTANGARQVEEQMQPATTNPEEPTA